MLVNSNVEIEKATFKSPSNDVFDTQNKYGQSIVSYGYNLNIYGDPFLFIYGTFDVCFDNNCLKNYNEVDARNLLLCEFLNFRHSSIEKFEIG